MRVGELDEREINLIRVHLEIILYLALYFPSNRHSNHRSLSFFEVFSSFFWKTFFSIFSPDYFFLIGFLVELSKALRVCQFSFPKYFTEKKRCSNVTRGTTIYENLGRGWYCYQNFSMFVPYFLKLLKKFWYFYNILILTPGYSGKSTKLSKGSHNFKFKRRPPFF